MKSKFFWPFEQQKNERISKRENFGFFWLKKRRFCGLEKSLIKTIVISAKLDVNFNLK